MIPVVPLTSAAIALVADHYGELMVPPFEFLLTETGFAVLVEVARADAAVQAEVVRIGVRRPGNTTARSWPGCRAGGHEVVELNSAAVNGARSEQLPLTMLTDFSKHRYWQGLVAVAPGSHGTAMAQPLPAALSVTRSGQPPLRSYSSKSVRCRPRDQRSGR